MDGQGPRADGGRQPQLNKYATIDCNPMSRPILVPHYREVNDYPMFQVGSRARKSKQLVVTSFDWL